MKNTILCLLLLSAGMVAAQTDEQPQSESSQKSKRQMLYHEFDKNGIARYVITFQPTELLLGRVRLDGSVRLPNTRGWLQLGLTAYPFAYQPDKDHNNFGWVIDDRYASMWGYGIDVNYRYFAGKLLYLAGGLSYHYADVSYAAAEWNTFTEDGLEYHERPYGIYRQHLHKPGVNIVFGYQKITRHAFVTDIYVGAGYRYGLQKYPKYRQFNSSPPSFGYKGLTFLFGFRIGFGQYW
ncbi:MAG: hypothetical protein LBS09_08915 [Bacteroidales bacterium]|jgi:hypothetical protein|nr:hypothetical protein [Bacteroidales bacterium]